MATREQIDRAARADRKPVGNRATDRLVTVHPSDPGEDARAARLVARQAPDLLDVLGLTAPARPRTVREQLGHGVLEDLHRALWERGDDAARAVAADLLPMEIDAARRELARRRGKP